jgi:hypothetical protein
MAELQHIDQVDTFMLSIPVIHHAPANLDCQLAS